MITLPPWLSPPSRSHTTFEVFILPVWKPFAPSWVHVNPSLHDKTEKADGGVNSSGHSFTQHVAGDGWLNGPITKRSISWSGLVAYRLDKRNTHEMLNSSCRPKQADHCVSHAYIQCICTLDNLQAEKLSCKQCTYKPWYEILSLRSPVLI